MKYRSLLIGLCLLLLTVPCFAGINSYNRNVTEFARDMWVDNAVLSSTGSSDIAVASTATVYTKSFKISNAEFFEVSYYAVSTAGTVDVTIELEESFQAPATEGAADSAWEEPVNFADIVTNFTTESDWKHKSVSPVCLPYVRFKITGNGSNNADAIVNIKYCQQKNG